MSTDIFTLQEHDTLEFALTMMDWSDLSSMCVEDTRGNLKGLISAKRISKCLMQKNKYSDVTTVGEIMERNPPTVEQQVRMVDVIKMMKEDHINILPVVKGEELIGIISERNFVNMSKRLIQGMSI